MHLTNPDYGGGYNVYYGSSEYDYEAGNEEDNDNEDGNEDEDGDGSNDDPKYPTPSPSQTPFPTASQTDFPTPVPTHSEAPTVAPTSLPSQTPSPTHAPTHSEAMGVYMAAATPTCPKSKKLYFVDLFDAHGDGWEKNVLNIATKSGQVHATVTMPDGYAGTAGGKITPTPDP